MTNTDRTDMDSGSTDPEMVSGTTGMGSDLDASMGGLSGSITPGSLSTADPNMEDDLGAYSDSISELDNDPTTVSGGPDLGGIMGGTGGMDATDEEPRHVLDSDAMEIEGSTSLDTDATVGRDSGVSAGIGEDAGDLTTGTGTDGGDMLGYNSDAGDPAGGTAVGMEQDTGGTAYYGGNTDDPTGSEYLSSTPGSEIDDNTNAAGI